MIYNGYGLGKIYSVSIIRMFTYISIFEMTMNNNLNVDIKNANIHNHVFKNDVYI